jgi:GTP pyrophosphokinase
MSIEIIVPEIDIEAENKEIVRRYRRLLRSAKPVIKDKDATLIRKAFELSMEAHKEMRRPGAEPEHGSEVAMLKKMRDKL